MLQFPIHTEAYRREKALAFADLWNIQKVSTDNGDWKYPSHMLGHAILLYAESGNLEFSVNGEKFLLEKGKVLCVSAGIRFGLCSTDNNATCFYLVRFNCSNLHLFTDEHSFCVSVLPSSIRDAFSEMYRAVHQVKRDSVSGDCYLLLLLQAVKQSLRSEPAQYDLFERTYAYILAHAKEDISAEGIADALRYNKDYLCRIVRKCSGKTVKELITEERINIAKGLLSTTDYPIEKIASLLRFSGANSFLKYFKYHMSMTPSEYRRRK